MRLVHFSSPTCPHDFRNRASAGPLCGHYTFSSYHDDLTTIGSSFVPSSPCCSTCCKMLERKSSIHGHQTSSSFVSSLSVSSALEADSVYRCIERHRAGFYYFSQVLAKLLLRGQMTSYLLLSFMPKTFRRPLPIELLRCYTHVSSAWRT